jgi:hypothetical protein
MDLLTNAIESIQVGIQDWETGTRPRLLSAVRNIHAGILLLFKEALVRLSSPSSHDVLVKAQYKPVMVNGEIKLVGVGKKTVDVPKLKERFKEFGIAADWKLYDQIADVRNDVEHYFADVTHASLRGVIAAAFVLIREFMERELEEKPLELLGQPTWQTMLKAQELYALERADCDKLFEGLNWSSEALETGVRMIRCRICGSDLLRPDVTESHWDSTLTCRSCGDVRTGDEFIPGALEAALEVESWVAAKDGADDPIGECPSCDGQTYVMSEGACALCGESATQKCESCGTAIPANEMGSSPLCGWCDHMMSKDD